MRQRDLLGPRLIIKVPSSLNKVSLQESSILIDSKLDEEHRPPTKKELIERVTKTASIHARLMPVPSGQQFDLKKATEGSRKNVSSQSKLTESARPGASYRIKSTSKIQSTKNIRPADTQNMRTLDSRLDSNRNKKDLVTLLEKRLEDPRNLDPRSRTMTTLKLKKQPKKNEDVEESSMVISHRIHTNMRSEISMPTEEDEDLEFEQFGFRTNRELYRYDLGSLSDPAPEQILKRYHNAPAPHGICPSYSGGRYLWVEIKLVGYSAEDSKYIVQLLDTKNIKRISRLSVVFKHQNLQQFKRRIRVAKAMQHVAMEQLRFEKYVDGLPNDKLPSSRLYHQQLMKLVDRPVKPSELKLLNSQAEAVFNRFTKKYAVMTEMQKRPLDFERMRLVPRKFIPSVETPEARFEGYQHSSTQIGQRHYSQFQRFSESVGLIYEKSSFLRDYVVFAKPAKLMKLHDFELLQSNTIVNNFDWLKKKWRDYLATEVQFKLKKTFDLYSTEDAVLALPTVYLKIHSEVFDNLIRDELHLGSIRKWERYLQSFYYSEDTSDLYRYSPAAIIDVSVAVTLPQKKKRKEDKQREKDRIGSAHKTVQKELLRVVPTEQEFMDCLLKPITILEQQICSMSCIDQDLFPTKKISRRLRVEHKQSPQIEKMVALTYSRLNGFLEDMKQYTHLLYEPDHERMPFEAQTLQTCRTVLDELEQNRRVIMNTFIHDYHMVRVDLSQFKVVFFERITAHKDQLLKRLDHSLKDEIKKLDKAFAEVRETLSKTPEDVKTLVELKAYTNRTDELLQELQKVYRLQGHYYSFLQDHFYQYDLNRYEEYLALVRCPVDIKLLLGDMRNNLKSQQSKFMEVINDDRQSLMKGLEDIKMDLKEAETLGPYNNCNKLFQQISRTNFQLEAFTDKLNNINERERLLKQTESIYEQLPKMIKSFEPYYQLWQLTSSFENDKEDWMTKNILSLNYDMVEKKLTGDYQREIMRLLKYFTNIKNFVAHGVCEEAKKAIERFKEKLWLIENLTCEGLMKKPNLFKEMFTNAGLPYIELKELNLTAIIECGLDKHRGIVEQASRKAEKIWGIEKKINEINEVLKQLELQLTPFQKTQTHIVNGFDDLLVVLDDQFNLLVMLKSSPYIKGVLGRTNTIESRIVLVRETLEIMIKCQSAWMYLQPIFSSGDIEKQMALESQKFQGVDRTWRMEMEYFLKDPLVWDSIESEVHKTRFESAHHILEEIQKSLSVYLESKRKIFPRFYFLSDDQLIEILSQTKDPFIINKHIGKCFEAISLLVFEGTKIKAMRSQEGEQVKFLSSIDVETPENKGNVEVWLKDIQYQMRESIREVAMIALRDTVRRDKWVLSYPAMIVLSANMTRWTFNTEVSIKNDSIRELFATLSEQLKGVVEMVRTDLNVLQRMTLEALVVIDVHNKDIVEKLMQKEKVAVTDFVWNSQLRYYSEQQPYKKGTRSQIVVKMINASINYCYEYLGNTTRLVITPLTDRCYRTLMGAIDLNYGGAPEGPAGTGKTETVKDLAKALAVQCVVFNCSDGLNYLAMTKFFKGLASSGAWCCFDEFNRIDLEVLSVIAQQVLTIQTAIKEKRKMFIFYGEDTALVRSCAINITMNPGYAGRSELPDNLKALFRPCAMMVPDYSLIGQIYLYSVGFQQARELSRKIVASLKLSSEQLSSQDHYDFGMRALKAILTAAGTLKRTSKQDEPTLCLRALLDVNMPKFTQKDIPLFSAITSDLFPRLKLPEGGYESLWKELKRIAQEERLDIKSWGLKVQQLWAIIKVRHGVMLVGQTLSGKTVAANVLAKILSTHVQKDFKSTDIIRLNPKSITTDSLYGRLDPISKSWSDGVLPLLMRKCISLQDGHNKWITFDGPVDAVWIENMNTVLDDNKKLCLTSGQIIKLINGMTMLFEVEDLSQASPATVSRCGMVYLQASMLGWRSLVTGLKLPEQLTVFHQSIVDESIRLIDLVLKIRNLKYTIVSEEMILVECFRKLLSINLKEIEKKKKPPTKQLINNLIALSVVWSIGAALHEDSRANVSAHLLKHLQDIKLPGANIFDYVFNLDRNAWVEWVAVQSKFRLPSGADVGFHQLIIPTKDTIRNSYFLRQYVAANCNLLVYGPTGTSKSCTIELALRQFHDQTTTYLQTSFSGQTTAKQIQQLIESKMTTRKRHNVFAPEQNRQKLVIFIDELNMPVKEKYGCQPPIELMRQMIESGGCYDLQTKQFKQLLGTVWISAMLPVKVITQRLLRHYQLIYVPAFEQDSLVVIYSSILDWFFTTVENPFGKEIRSLGDKVVEASIKIFHLVQNCKELLPTPDKSHYVYNMRDLSKIFQGMVRVNGKTVSGQLDFLRLWSHECRRVFQDRMISLQHKKAYDGLVSQVLEKVFRKTDPAITAQPCFYSALVDGDYRYQTLQTIKSTIEDSLHQYNSTYKNLHMVLFTSAVEHIARAVRILATEGSHLLLIGLGGSGRKSVCKLAVYICFSSQTQVFESNWEEEVLQVVKVAGVDERPTTFIVDDRQITRQDILEDVSNLLNRSEIPRLVTGDVRAQMLQSIKYQGTPLEKYQQLVRQCKKNMHVVVCMSPIGGQFRKRLRLFPSLVNCTSIDWFASWSEQALTETAVSVLTGKMDGMRAVVQCCVKMHQDVISLTNKYRIEHRKYCYVTPTNYLELLSAILRISSQRRRSQQQSIHKYNSGTLKIEQTEKEVAKMKAYLQELQPKLEQSKKQNQKLLVNLKASQAEADQKRKNCQMEQRQCDKQRHQANRLKEECQEELNKVLPLLQNAAETLEKITKDDMVQLRSFLSPPLSAASVMEGMCYVFNEDQNVKAKVVDGEKVQDFWEYSKKNILNDKLIKRVKDFKIDQVRAIPALKIERLKVFMQKPQFEKERVFNASKAAGNLSLWIRAVVDTYEALLIVDPKKHLLSEAQKQLLQSELMLRQKQDALTKVLEVLRELQNNYDKARKEKEELEAKVNKVKTELGRAEKLTLGLSTEKEQWKRRAEKLKKEGITIIGDSVLGAGVINYLGPFPLNYRESTISDWRSDLLNAKIRVSNPFSLQQTFGDPLVISEWTNIMKLPNDPVSIDNSIMMHKSRRFPLLIDPQDQAFIFIKNLEQNRKLMILKPSTPVNELMFKLETCMQVGIPILLENVRELSNIFTPLLEKNVSNGRLRYGDKFMSYSDDFMFYMTTKDDSQHFAPETCMLVTLLNFSITRIGLTNQLQNMLLTSLHPVQSQNLNNTYIEISTLSHKLLQTQKTILQLLEKTQDILGDDKLIEVLDKSKVEAVEVEERLKKCEQTKKDIEIIRKGLLNDADIFSNWYFATESFVFLQSVYRWSLDSFKALLLKVLGSNRQLAVIRRKFFDDYYHYINRSLFEKDRLQFVLLIAINNLLREKKIRFGEVRLMMVGPVAATTKPNPIKQLTAHQWAAICELEQQCAAFKNLTKNQTLIRKVLNSNNPATDATVEMNFFYLLLLIRFLRPEKFIGAIYELVRREVGEKYLESPPFDLPAAFAETRFNVPLLFLMTTGADPRLELLSLAEQEGNKQVQTVSLGQGQKDFALKAINKAMKEGEWVLLQNCHLSPSFMPELERLYENFPEVVSDSFRLFLSSMPTEVIPVSILTNCVKLTFEPPASLKNTLLLLFGTMGQKEFEESTDVLKGLVFNLSFFHSVLLERRRFGPVGWNIPYEFTVSDFRVSLSAIRQFFLQSNEPWDTVNYMVGEAYYGGRVTDPNDRRFLVTLLERFMNPEAASPGHLLQGSFAVPELKTLAAYSDEVSRYKITQPAEVFGLHQNAEITSQILKTSEICASILSILPQESEGTTSIMTVLEDVLKKLPQKPASEEITKHPIRYEQSINTVLHQELERYSRLYNRIQKDLKELIQTQNGEIQTTTLHQELIRSLLENRVPRTWGNGKLSSWLGLFSKQMNFLNSWLRSGQPKSFFVPGFIFPQGFFTAILQNYSRRHQVSVDKLRFDFRVMNKQKTETELPKEQEGCYIHGLVLEAARWNREENSLEEQRPNELYSDVPFILVKPTESSKQSSPNIYECPVYKNSERRGVLSTTGHSSNFILSMQLPTKISQSHWVLRGVAMIAFI